MTTLDAMISRCQLALNDAGAGTWPTATIQQWIQDACREYSNTYPRMRVVSYNLAAGDHTYALPADFTGVVSLECPTGQDPPKYLTMYSHLNPDFWDNDDYYSVEQGDDPNNPGTLYIGLHPAGTETMELHYHALHLIPALTTDNLTNPVEHDPILVRFVVFQAMRERLATEAKNPDTTTPVLAALVRAARDAEQSYIQSLRRAHEDPPAPGGWTGPWKSDIHDPIY